MNSRQNSDHTVPCGQILVLNYIAYGKMGPSRRSSLSLFLCRISFSVYLSCLESLLYPVCLYECPYDKVLHPRVISPRQPPSMVLEVYVLARTEFKSPKRKFRDTSPADRSLRVQAMIGSGLMARDILLCTFMNPLCIVDPMCIFGQCPFLPRRQETAFGKELRYTIRGERVALCRGGGGSAV